MTLAFVMLLTVSCKKDDEPKADHSVAAKINTFNIISPVEINGIINENSKTITIAAPVDADLTSAEVLIELPEGATVSPASGDKVDLSDPVEFKVTGSDADGNPVTQVYVASVVRSASIVFVGNEPIIDELEDDAKAAALWMQETFGNDFSYLSASAINANTLEDVKVIFYYELKGEKIAPNGTLINLGAMSDEPVSNAIADFVKNGGQLLLAGDAAQYVFDINRVPSIGYGFGEVVSPGIEAKEEDDIWGLSVVEGTTSADRTNHPLFDGLLNIENRIELNNSTEREVRLIWWTAGTEASGDNCCGEVSMVTSFEEHLKAVKLGSIYDINDYFGIAAVEFERTDMETQDNFNQNISKDFKGTVLMLGNTIIGYEWVPNDGSENAFQGNIEKLTHNAINYLLEVYETTNQ